MKRLMVLMAMVAMVVMAGSALAQQWTVANQITVAWDPVTVASGTVSYKVYSKPENGGPETLLDTVTTAQYTATFSVEGRYFLGARAVRTVGGVDIDSTRISWSDTPGDVLNGETFGAQYYLPPGNVGGLKILK